MAESLDMQGADRQRLGTGWAQKLKERRYSKYLMAAGLVTTTVVCGVFVAGASNVDAERVLGMEDTNDWTVQNGSVVVATQRTQGSSSLEVDPGGYTVMTSRLIGPLGDVANDISLDIQLPSEQPNPYWYGDLQLFVSVPSLNIYNKWLGQRNLTGLPLGEFVQQNFHLEPDLREALGQSYFDLQFSIVLNVPNDATGSYLVDNLQVSSEIPGHSTISSFDLSRILGFESDDDWSADRGTLTLSSSTKTQGNTSLAVIPDGYTTVSSVPMTSIGPVDPQVSFDLFVPEEQPNEYWFGSAQLYLDSPALGLNNYYVGESQLTGLQVGAFHSLEFPLGPETQGLLNSAGYSDLRVRVALNVPQGVGAYFLDNIQIGEVTRPMEPVQMQLRGDLVGRTSSGMLSIEYKNKNDSPSIGDALFHVKSEDGDCYPGPATVCRFLVNVVRVRVESFELGDASFSGAIIRNVDPFRLVLGGSAGTTVPVPPGTRFIGYINKGQDLYTAPLSATNTYFTLDPAGGGVMSLSGSFSGSLNGDGLTASGVITADSPLLNRPPVANAGADQSVTSTTCGILVDLNGSGSTDPDGNLDGYVWRVGDSVVATGPTPQVLFHDAGSWLRPDPKNWTV